MVPVLIELYSKKEGRGHIWGISLLLPRCTVLPPTCWLSSLAIPLLPLRKDIKKILDSMGIDGSTRSSVSWTEKHIEDSISQGVSRLAIMSTGRAVAVFTAQDLQLLGSAPGQSREGRVRGVSWRLDESCVCAQSLQWCPTLRPHGL